jgi:cyanophycinase
MKRSGTLYYDIRRARCDLEIVLGVCDKNVEPFEDVTEPRPQGSDTTSAARPGVRGSASDRSRLGFRPFLHAFHFYVAHPSTGSEHPADCASQLRMFRLERTLCCLLFLSILAADEPGYKYLVLGQPAGSVPKTVPGYALMGGGQDQDAAFQWMCDHAGGGNFLVLRASGTDAYNSYIRKLCPALSAVETLIITSREGAGHPFVAEKMRAAAAVFIAGGSQDNYVNFWRGTPVEEAINSAITRGVPVGGTSAGLAVLGEYSFAALKDTVKSSEALANPFHERVTITRDFLHLSLLDGKITDSHFVARDRMGRLLAFLARIATDGRTRAPFGIGIDEKTVVLM